MTALSDLFGPPGAGSRSIRPVLAALSLMGRPASVPLVLASLWLTASLLMLAVTPALASHEPPRLGLKPVDQEGQYFDLTLDPGAIVELGIEITNFGHDTVLARTYVADAYSLINGGFGAELHGEAPTGPSLWVEFEARELTLADGAEEVIGFVVSVPEDTAPGEYITSLVAENADPYRDAEQPGVEVDQVNRTAVAIAIDVPGPRESELEIGAVAHKSAAGTSFLTFEVINAGDIHVRPSGELTLRGADGAEVAAFELAMDTVYAGTETLLEVVIADSLAPGDYCAELELIDQAADITATTECLEFTVTTAQEAGGGGLPPVLGPIADTVAGNPLLVGLAVLAAALAVAAGLYGWRRRRGRDSGIAQPGDGWPRSDPLDAAPALPRSLSLVIERALITPLRAVPEVHHAWLMRHDSYLELALEMAAGTGIAHGSAIAHSIRTEVGDLVEGVPLLVVVLEGRGIIARRTAGQPPVYVRDAPARSDQPALQHLK